MGRAQLSVPFPDILWCDAGPVCQLEAAVYRREDSRTANLLRRSGFASRALRTCGVFEFCRMDQGILCMWLMYSWGPEGHRSRFSMRAGMKIDVHACGYED
eukprot:jgi/Ulvmu1/6546/UM003_0180.1